MNDLRDFCIRVEEEYSGSNSGKKSDAYILTWWPFGRTSSSYLRAHIMP